MSKLDRFRKISLLANGNLFCALFNLENILLGRPGRINYEASTKMYFSKFNGDKLYFSEKKRSWVYNKGVNIRVSQLAESYFLDKINFKKDDLVVDCGANIGELYFYFSKKPGVKYVGIEPSPKEFEYLKKNAITGHLHNLGLWHENGELAFYVSSEEADSSLIKPPNFDKVIKVSTRRLDSIINTPVKLLKIEAEGAEPEVIEGCEKLLSQTQYITADLGYERGIDQQSTLDPVTKYLSNQGFELLEISYKHEYPNTLALAQQLGITVKLEELWQKGIAALFKNKSIN